jgi:hypothetical protein
MIKVKDKNKINEKYQSKVSEFKQADKELWENESLKSSILSAVPHAVIGLRERKIFLGNKRDGIRGTDTYFFLTLSLRNPIIYICQE